jgi:hypothetical protein
MLPVLNISQRYDSSAFLHGSDEFQLLKGDAVKEIYSPCFPKPALNLWEDKNEQKIYTCSFVKQQEAIDRWIDLSLKFKTAFAQKKHLFSGVSPDKISRDFYKSLENILSLSPETITVGVSDDECVCIYFEKNSNAVYFDLFFEPAQTEACVGIFENKVAKLSFTDYLDASIRSVRNEFTTEHELPLQAFAAR